MDLKAFKRRAKLKNKEITTFLKGLHKRKVKNLNSTVKKLHAETFTKIDCLDCANCCKTMVPTYRPSEIKRIAAHLNISPKAYFDKYLELDEDGDTKNRKTPCHFLGKDNKCSIYEIRPLDCRGFPHTDKSPVLHATSVNIENIKHCPAVLNIFERLKEIVVK